MQLHPYGLVRSFLHGFDAQACTWMSMPAHPCASMRMLVHVVERLHCLVEGELKDAARAAAKQRGQSLTMFVIRALEAALPMPSASQKSDPAGGPRHHDTRSGSVASSSLQNFMPKGQS